VKKLILFLGLIILVFTKNVFSINYLGLFTDRSRSVYMQGEKVEVVIVVLTEKKIENKILSIEAREIKNIEENWASLVNKNISLDAGKKCSYIYRIDTNFIKPGRYEVRGVLEDIAISRTIKIDIVSNISNSNFYTIFKSLENGQSAGSFFNHDGIMSNPYYKDDPERYAKILKDTGINLVYEPFPIMGKAGQIITKGPVEEENYQPTMEQRLIEALLQQGIKLGVFPGHYWEKISFSDPVMPMAVFLLPQYQEAMIKRVHAYTQVFSRYPNFFGFTFMADTTPGWSYWQTSPNEPHYQVWQDIVKTLKEKPTEETGLSNLGLIGGATEVSEIPVQDILKWVNYTWNSLPFTFKLYNESAKIVNPKLSNTTCSSGTWIYYWPFFCPPDYVFKELDVIDAWHHNEISGLDFLRVQFDIDIAKSGGNDKQPVFGLSSFYFQKPGPDNRTRDLWLSAGRGVSGIGQTNWPILNIHDLTSTSLYSNGRYQHAWETAKFTYQLFSKYGPLIGNLENKDTIALLVSPNNNEAHPPRIDIYKQIEAYAVLRMANLPARAVLESEVRERGLDKHYKVLFLVALPKTSYNLFDEKMRQRVEEFVRQGGKIVADKESSEWNIQGLIKTDIVFERYPIINCTDNSKIVFLRNQKNIEKLKDIFKPLIPEFPEGKNVICETLYGNNTTLLIVASNSILEYGDPVERIKPIIASVKLNGLSGILYDLFEHKKIGKVPEELNEINVDFRPYPVRVYLLLCDEIEKIKAEVSLNGQNILLRGSVIGKNNQILNSLPIQVTVRNPKQQVRYSLYRAVKSGYYEEILPLAFNDPPGEWTVEIRELVTGKTVSIKFPFQTVIAREYIEEVKDPVLIFGQKEIKRFLKNKEHLSIIIEDNSLFNVANELVQKLKDKIGIQASIKKPEDVIIGDVKSDHMRSFINPVYITLKENMLLLGNPKNNRLIADINQADLFQRYVSENYPGHGRAAIFYIYSPFVGGYDAICLIGNSEYEIRMAADSLLKLLTHDTNENEDINDRKTKFSFQQGKLYSGIDTEGNLDSDIKEYPIKPISAFSFTSNNKIIVGTSGYGNNLFFFEEKGNLLWSKRIGSHTVLYLDSIKDNIIAVTSGLLLSAVGKEGKPRGDHFGTRESIIFPRISEPMDKTFWLDQDGRIKSILSGALSYASGEDGSFAIGGWGKINLFSSEGEVIFSWDNWMDEFPVLEAVNDIDYDAKQHLLAWIEGEKVFLADVKNKTILWEDREFPAKRIKIYPEGKVFIYTSGKEGNRLIIRNRTGAVIYRSPLIPSNESHVNTSLPSFYNLQFLSIKREDMPASNLDSAVAVVSDGWRKISFVDEKLKKIQEFQTEGVLFVNKMIQRTKWGENITWDPAPSCVKPIPGFDMTPDRKFIVLVDDTHTVYFLDDTCKLLWKKQIGSGFQVKFSSDGEKILVAGWKGDLTLIDRNGNIVWQNYLSKFSKENDEIEKKEIEINSMDTKSDFFGTLSKYIPEDLPENLLKNSAGKISRGKRPEKNDIKWLIDGEVSKRDYPHLSEDADIGVTPQDNKRGATFTGYNLPTIIEINLPQPVKANLICVWDGAKEGAHYVSTYKIEVLSRQIEQKSSDFRWQPLVIARNQTSPTHSHWFKTQEVKGIRYIIAETDDSEIWTEEIGLYYVEKLPEGEESKFPVPSQHQIFSKSQTDTTNLFNNPGFEDGYVGWQFGKGVSLTEDFSHSGTSSVKIESDSGPGVILISNIPVGSGYGRFLPNINYSVSFWAKGEPETGWEDKIIATMLLEKDIDKIVQTITLKPIENSRTKDGWVKFSSDFVMSEEVARSKGAYYYFTIWLPKIPYTIWLDDFEFRRVENKNK